MHSAGKLRRAVPHSRSRVHIPAGPAPWWAAQPGHGCGRPLSKAGPEGEGAPASARLLPVLCTPAVEKGDPHTDLHHRDDEGQCLPTACWGRNTEVARPVAASAHQKPTGCALQEGGNHSCLDWMRKGEREVVFTPRPRPAASLPVTSGLGCSAGGLGTAPQRDGTKAQRNASLRRSKWEP